MDTSIYSMIEKFSLSYLVNFLERSNNSILLEKYNDIIDIIKQQGFNKIKNEFYEFIDKSKDTNAKNYKKIKTNFNLSEPEELLLCICISSLVSPEFSGIVSDVSKFVRTNAVTLEFIFIILNDDDISKYKASFNKIKYLLVYKSDNIPYYKYPLGADERLTDFLHSDDVLDKHISEFSYLFTPKNDVQSDFSDSKINNDLQNFVNLREKQKENIIIQIAGANGNGKKLFLKTAYKNINKNCIFVNYSYLAELDLNVFSKVIKYIIREAILNNADVSLYNLKVIYLKNNSSLLRLTENCCKSLISKKISINLLSEPNFEVSSYLDSVVVSVPVKNYTRNQQAKIWKGYFKQYGIKSVIDVSDLSNRFKLSAGEINKVTKYMSVYEKNGQVLEALQISRLCYKCMSPINHGNVKHIESSYDFEDLKLPQEQKQVLKNICNHVIYRNKVFDNWEMEKKYAYGKGISALFVGPPGTGKTMAANVLAGMLKLELYRVDISQIVDKYIGETEKKLEEIFSIAENSNMILFFDEADAIFGKRSEVNEAKDRFANTEISYILQRIEDYDGVVILASNYKKNIDDAFMRRIRYMIDFQMPGAEIRKSIWMSCLTDKVPIDGIDFDYLSNQFELSGGCIKNIVLNATFLAASENCDLNMKHILESIKNENIKLGKVMLKQDFGAYGHIMS